MSTPRREGPQRSPQLSDPAVRRALAITPHSTAAERTVDITTTGAKTGTARRIEIWFYRVGGVVYLSGTPGARGWAANLRAHPSFTFHLKGAVAADLPATAREIADSTRRRAVLGQIVDDLNQPTNPGCLPQPVSLEDWLAGSPLFEVQF